MRTIFRTGATLALLAAATLTLACSGTEQGDESRPPTEPPGVPKYSIAISTELDSLDIGASKALSAQVRDRKGAVVAIAPEWKTSDPTIATISPLGVVEGIAPGSTQVIASVSGGADTATIVVRNSALMLHLQPSAASLAAGDELAFQAKVITVATGAAFGGVVLEWQTSDPAIATVDEQGTVTTLAEGDVTITAKAGALTASAAVNVRKSDVASVTLAPANSSIYPGEQLQLKATAFNADGRQLRNKSATFSSSDNAVATVSSTGMVSGVARGTAVITADVEGTTASATVRVLDAAAASVAVVLSSATIATGQSTQATATVRDASGNLLSGKTIGWQSSNPSIATVNASGVVAGVGNGNVTINAIVDGKVGNAPLTVAPATATSITVTPSSASVQAGQTAQLTAQVKDQNGNLMNNQTITWSSADPGIATVSSTGLVTGVSGGSAMVTARSGTVSANATVSVTATPVASIAISPTYKKVAPGETYTIAVTAKDAAGNTLSGRVASWTSTNPAIATVDANGVVTGKAEGFTEIFANVEGKSGRAEAEVTSPTTPVASVTLTANATSLSVGQSTQITATLKDASGNVLSGRPITWASVNPTLASVSASGLVSALAAGSATITATSEGKVGAFTLSITALAPAPVASITVTPNASTLNPGQTTQLNVTLKDANGNVLTGRSISYGVDNPVVASVSASGLVTALAVGSVNVSVTSEGKVGMAPITVTSQQTTPTIGSVTVTLSTTSITVGQTAQATATARSTTGSAMTCSPNWSVVNGLLVASVNSSGVVTGLSAGSATVQAACGTVVGTASIGVTAPVTSPPPSGLPEDLAVRATLPRATVPIPAMPTGGRTIRVAQGQNLQTVLDTARRKDIILLAAGATFTGEFKLPAKPGSAADGWIVVMSEGTLPAPGTRVTPTTAANFARIRTPTAMAAIEATKGASGWHFIGLDIGANTTVTDNWGLVVFDAPYAVSALADIPSDFVIERSYIHGHGGMSTSRCVSLQSARSAVVDSWLSACHAKDRDSQAIGGWAGPGPYLIQNNYLEGAGETIMFGGADPAVQDVSPSDITIRGNYFFKPLSWQNRVWLVKNHIELKHAQRVLIEQNVFQNHWADAQDGWAFVFISINQNGGWGAWSTVRDVTFRFNRVDNVPAVLNISERYDAYALPAARFTIEHNLFTNVGAMPGTAGVYLLQGATPDIRIENNTGFGNPARGAWFQLAHAAPLPRLTVRNNIGGNAVYNMISPIANDKDILTKYSIPAGNFVGNVVVTQYPSSMPANNFSTGSVGGVGLVNPSGFTGDWSLSLSSPFKGKASVGGDPGVGFSTLITATSKSM